jgi:hypothetical protein
MSLADQIQIDLVAAMRAKDSFRLSALRLIKTAFKNKEVDKGTSLSEDEERAVLQTLLKQRRDAASQFRDGNRPELAAKEDQEVELIQHYLPAAATDAEILASVDSAITETGASSIRDMGKVMKVALGLLESKTVDGGKVSSLVKERLGSE